MAKIEHRGLVQVDARWLASLLGAALLVPPLTVRGADAADAIAQPDASAGAADSSKKSGSKKSGSKKSGSKTSGSKTSGSKTSGSKTSGSKKSGSKKSGSKKSGSKKSGSKKSGSKKSGSETSPTSDSDTDAQPPAEETERTEAPDDAPASDTVPAASDDEKETRDQALQRLFDDASRERDEGDLARAVELFQQALKTIPSEQHEARASVLFLLVDVLRSAVTVEDEPGYLCVAERDLLVFLEGVRRDYGPEGDELRDVQKAKALLEEVRALLARASEEHPELDCEDPFGDAPAPARDDETARLRAALRAETEREAARRRTMLIAGATTTGIGVAALGVMTAGLVIGALAERDGQALVDDALVMGAPLPERDPALLELERRGQTGNLIAIAGGVAGAVALGVGVPLLVAGAKKPAEPLVSLLPLLSRRGVGASLTLRF